MSSTISPRCGSSSLSSMPHSPWLGELPRDCQQLALASAALSYLMSPLKLLPVPLGEFRLGIEQIDMARPALHEHRDHRRACGGRCAGLGSRSNVGFSSVGLAGSARRPVLLQQPGERDGAEADSIDVARKWRRLTSQVNCMAASLLIDVQEFVRTQQRLAKRQAPVRPDRGGFGIGLPGASCSAVAERRGTRRHRCSFGLARNRPKAKRSPGAKANAAGHRQPTSASTFSGKLGPDCTMNSLFISSSACGARSTTSELAVGSHVGSVERLQHAQRHRAPDLHVDAAAELSLRRYRRDLPVGACRRRRECRRR